MANPLNLNNQRSDAGGYAEINCTATATYVRSGSSVTITVTVKVYDSQGHYFNVTLNGAYVIEQQNTTVTKTFTYDDASAKTYSFPMVAYIQTAAGYTGESTTGTLTIDVPAAGDVWVKISDTVWEKTVQNQIKTDDTTQKKVTQDLIKIDDTTWKRA